jgi:ATP-dependent Clp protease ATP-binding subunit ClpB
VTFIPLISWIPQSYPLPFLQKKTSHQPLEDMTDLQDLAHSLTSEDCTLDQWLEWKNDIRTFISEHAEDLEQLDEFFRSITDWGLERNPQKLMTVLADIVSLDLMKEVIRIRQESEGHSYDDIFDVAAENAPYFPKPIDDSMKTRIYSEWKKYRYIILHFIPNILNIFLGAFNFLDTHKKYTTLWDKHLLLEIVYKFFIIPYCLIKVLQPIFIVTTKVYLVAALIIFATGILVSVYQRWFRPLPDEVVNCTNLDKLVERGLIDPKVGQRDEIDSLIAGLEVNANILLIGLSGSGKTALIHHFIQLKQEGKLPKKLEKMTVYGVDCGLMMSHVSFGHAELINQLREQIEGYEDNVLLFFDDFDQIASNATAFRTFKKRFLEDQPRVRFIAAMTQKTWEDLKNQDTDYSFRRRIYRKRMNDSTDEEIWDMIWNLQCHNAQDIPVTEDAINAIVEISDKEDYLPEVGRAAKAEELFKTAVGLCRAAYNHHYGPLKLNPDELKENRRQIQKVRRILIHHQKMNNDYYRLTHLFARVNALPVVVEPEDFDLEHLDNIDILDKEEKEIPLPSSIDVQKSITPRDQILYLWYQFYAIESLKKLLTREIEKVDDQIPRQVDSDLIYRVYNEIKEFEEGDQATSSKKVDKNEEESEEDLCIIVNQEDDEDEPI